GVPEVGDEDSPLQARDEPVGRPRARLEDEARPERAPGGAALDRMAGTRDIRRLRGPPRVQQGAGDAIADEVEGLLRRALDVERDAEGVRVGHVLAEVDRRVELRLADGRE